jgi:hypothetical protein
MYPIKETQMTSAPRGIVVTMFSLACLVSSSVLLAQDAQEPVTATTQVSVKPSEAINRLRHDPAQRHIWVSGDGQHYACLLVTGLSSVVLEIDGKRGEELAAIDQNNFRIAQDFSKAAYWATGPDGQPIYVIQQADGTTEKFPKFIGFGVPGAPPPKHDASVWEAVDDPVVGGKLCFVPVLMQTRTSGLWAKIGSDGPEIGPVSVASRYVTFDEAGTHYVAWFVRSKADVTLIYHDGRKVAELPDATTYEFQAVVARNGGYAFWIKTGHDANSRWHLFLNGKELSYGSSRPPMTPVISPNGRRVAWVETLGGGSHYRVIVDGDKHAVHKELPHIQNLRFTTDSKHVVYAAAGNGLTAVIVDGNEVDSLPREPAPSEVAEEPAPPDAAQTSPADSSAQDPGNVDRGTPSGTTESQPKARKKSEPVDPVQKAKDAEDAIRKLKGLFR